MSARTAQLAWFASFLNIGMKRARRSNYGLKALFAASAWL